MRKYLAIIAAAIAVSGCATSPTPLASASPAPRERVTAFQEQTPETGTLIITRDSGVIGGGCFYSVSINGKQAARLDTGETARFYVPTASRRGIDLTNSPGF